MQVVESGDEVSYDDPGRKWWSTDDGHWGGKFEGYKQIHINSYSGAATETLCHNEIRKRRREYSQQG